MHSDSKKILVDEAMKRNIRLGVKMLDVRDALSLGVDHKHHLRLAMELYEQLQAQMDMIKLMDTVSIPVPEPKIWAQQDQSYGLM